MRVVARVLLWAAGLLGVIMMLGFGLLLYVTSWRPAYDTKHPNYEETARRLASVAEQLRAVYGRGEPRPAQGVTLDLSHLNGGGWTKACLFGGYTEPSLEIEVLGGRVSSADAERFREIRETGFRLEVEEFEAVVAYVDPAGDAHFIHLPRGIGPYGQWFEKCIDRLAPVMVID